MIYVQIKVLDLGASPTYTHFTIFQAKFGFEYEKILESFCAIFDRLVFHWQKSIKVEGSKTTPINAFQLSTLLP
jgi:hypothetical protein